MRALTRLGIGLAGLLLVGSISNGYVLISPVTKCPLGHAPDMRSVCPVYYMGQDGHVYGPYYYLRPSFPPIQPCLPGPIGQAIQSGYLPHELLMSKEAMNIGNMPLLIKPKGNNKEGGPPTQPQMASMGPPAPNGESPGDMPDMGAYSGPAYTQSGVPGPFPMWSGPNMMSPAQQAQVPYMGNGSGPGMMPNGGMPYNQQMPYPGSGGGMAMMPNTGMPVTGVPMMYPRPMPYPMNGPAMGMMPNGGMPMMVPRPMPMMYPQPMPMPYPQPMPMPAITNRPTAYAPYGGMIPYAMQNPYGGGGIWLVQNTAPNSQANPFMAPMPNGAVPFNPYAARSPMYNVVPYPMPMPYGRPYPYPPTMQGMMMPNPYGGYMSMPTIPSLPSMMSAPSMPSMSPMPSVSSMPTIPSMPSMSNISPYPAFQPYGSLDRLTPLRRPQTAQMDPLQMELPRMDMVEPPMKSIGNAYPTHPFVHSPRDFFMWGDSMDDERARGNRPFPVP